MGYDSWLERPYAEQANRAAAIEHYKDSLFGEDDAIEWFCHSISRDDRVQMFCDLGGADFEESFNNWLGGGEE